MDSKYIFLDTSALYAFFDKGDNDHKIIKESLRKRTEEFVTSNYIVDELITLFRVRKISVNKFGQYIEELLKEKMCLMFYVNKETDNEAWEIMRKYKDHNFSFTDCVSFALMKKNNIKYACTIDKHFLIFGFSVIPDFIPQQKNK